MHGILPFATAQTIPLQDGMRRGKAAEIINSTLENLDIRWDWRQKIWTGVGFARKNVWSRAARRKQARLAATGEDKDTKMEDEDSEEDEKIALAFMISIRESEVDVRWLRGLDSVLFESFGGMLKRVVRESGH